MRSLQYFIKYTCVMVVFFYSGAGRALVLLRRDVWLLQ